MKNELLKELEKEMLKESLRDEEDTHDGIVLCGRDDEEDMSENEFANMLMDSLGETLYGNIVICAEDGDFPKSIIRKIKNTAKKYKDKYPAIEKPAEKPAEKPVETQAQSETQAEPSEEKVFSLWDAVHDNNK